ncbi:MAG: hypothetical protein ABIR24_05105 [Verrucomicrobiota bacterium]
MFAATPDDLLASYHFVGAANLAKNTNATKLKEIWALPETAQFRGDVLQKLAGASLKYLGADSGNARQVALARPLFDDLLRVESQAELRGKTNSGAEFILAARLSEERSKLWETNLLQLAKASKPQLTKMDEISGWQAKAGANFLKFFRAEKWTVIVLGPEQSPAQSDFLKRLQKQPANSPSQEWLAVDVDWPRLTPRFPLDKYPLKLARTELRVTGKGENLRTTVRAIYPDKIDWKSQGWQIPKELIRDPLISFSAGQKLAPFLNSPKVFERLSFNPLTNQFFFWAQSQMPFQSYVALPVKDPTNTMRAFAPQIVTAFNDDLKRREGGELRMASNRVDLFWHELPIIVPFLQTAKEKNGAGFLLGGLFPIAPNTNLPPSELFGQVSNHNDLVYYDWEITQERLSQWMILGQLLPLFPREPIVSTNAALRKGFVPAKVPEHKWLAAIAPKLGNTITEITFKAPNELNLVRKSHLGLNSIELVLLSHWLAGPNFPSTNNSSAAPMARPALDAPRRGRPERP